MKNMTNFRARTLCKKEIVSVFKALRIKDGIGENTDKSSDLTYWYNKARDGMIGNYIIYEIVSSDPLYRADNAIIGRDVFCQIDVFSVQSYESKALKELMERLEEKLIEKNFEVEMREESFEPDTRLYHQVLYISKLYI